MKLVIVTPLRDESENIHNLYQAIEQQTTPIHSWIIVENDSTDDSREILRNLSKPTNVSNLIILNISLGGEYALGFKYAGVVERGFQEVRNQNIDFDFIGVLDADCFPEPNYYQVLIDTLKKDSSIGIISGVINESGKVIHDSGHARGGCRVWTRDCFEDSGYLVSMSADSVSEVLARLKGWRTVSVNSAFVNSRTLGYKVNYRYYGKSSYYRGLSVLYVILKGFIILFRVGFTNSKNYILGYFESLFNKEDRIENKEVYNFYRNYLGYKIKHFFKK